MTSRAFDIPAGSGPAVLYDVRHAAAQAELTQARNCPRCLQTPVLNVLRLDTTPSADLHKRETGCCGPSPWASRTPSEGNIWGTLVHDPCAQVPHKVARRHGRRNIRHDDRGSMPSLSSVVWHPGGGPTNEWELDGATQLGHRWEDVSEMVSDVTDREC